MPEHYIELLKHILDECNFIHAAVPDNVMLPKKNFFITKY